jgi:hypothetical protein
MTNPLHRFYWEDSEFRGWAYALIAVAGIAYATTRTLVFHRPERQVAVELCVLVLVLNFVAVALNYLWSRESSLLSATDIGTVTQQFRHGPLAGLPSVLSSTWPPPSYYVPRTYRLSPKVRYGGIAACLILLIGPKLSVSKVQAAIVNQRLERAASSVEPDKAAGLSSNQLKTRFQKIASIASASTQYKISANPDVVERVKNNLEETLRSVNPGEDVRRSGVSAFIKLVAYARFNDVLIAVNAPTILIPHDQGQTGNYMLSQVPLKNGAVWWQGSAQGSTIFGMPEPGSEPVFPVSHSSVVFNAVNFNAFGMRRAFVGTDNESQVVIMNATIEGAAQKLDAIVWLNIKFKNSQIIYNGGPLYLGDVAFENCQFQVGSDPESQKVLTQIKTAENQPVTLVSGL